LKGQKNEKDKKQQIWSWKKCLEPPKIEEYVIDADAAIDAGHRLTGKSERWLGGLLPLQRERK
jgi:hypothetical protein